MHLSDKTIIKRPQTSTPALPSAFVKDDLDATLGGRGYKVIHEKAYLCPCKAKESDHRSTCKNCGGTGWIFANPTETRMVITGIMMDDKLKEGPLKDWGMIDKGACKVTANNVDKLNYMDRIRNIDATGEFSQLVYPKRSNDGTQLFAFTKYDIKDIDFVGRYVGDDQVLQKLEEGDDFTYSNNVVYFNPAMYDANLCITIRFVYHPEFHIAEVLRESMTSYNEAKQKLILPVHAVAMRAHLVPDVENFDGDRILNNSWLPDVCGLEEFTKFQRQLRHTSTQNIYDNLTQLQIVQLRILLGSDSEDNMQLLKVHMSSAEILQLNTTPRELVPAPGVGKTIQIFKILIRLNFGSIAYSNLSNIQLKLDNNVLISWSNVLSLNNDNFSITSPSDIQTTMQDFSNKPIIATAAVNPTDGDGSVDFYISYTIVDVT